MIDVKKLVEELRPTGFGVQQVRVEARETTVELICPDPFTANLGAACAVLRAHGVVLVHAVEVQAIFPTKLGLGDVA